MRHITQAERPSIGHGDSRGRGELSQPSRPRLTAADHSLDLHTYPAALHARPVACPRLCAAARAPSRLCGGHPIASKIDCCGRRASAASHGCRRPPQATSLPPQLAAALRPAVRPRSARRQPAKPSCSSPLDTGLERCHGRDDHHHGEVWKMTRDLCDAAECMRTLDCDSSEGPELESCESEGT